MINNKGLYGKLNKETAKPYYGGGSTDSLQIIVDNVNMLITGEVKWSDILGFTADKAYPGNLGKETTDLAYELSSKLEEEIAISTAARKQLMNLINLQGDELESFRKAIEQKLSDETSRAQSKETEIVHSLLVETERAMKAEQDLLTQLTQEIQARQTDYEKLDFRIDTLDSISTEGIGALVEKLAEEIQRAKEAEQLLSKSLTEEKRRALVAEDNLKVLIDNLGVALTGIDNELRSIIEAVKSELSKDIQELKTQIDSEVNRAVKSEQEISDNLSKLKEDYQKTKYTVIENKNKLDVQAQAISDNSARIDSDRLLLDAVTSITNEHTISLSALAKEIANEIQRASTTEIEIIKTVEDLSSNYKLTKRQVNELSNQVAELLENDPRDSIAELYGLFDQELSARIAEDLAINQKIDTEISRAQTREEELDAATKDLSKKVARNFNTLLTMHNQSVGALGEEHNTLREALQEEIETRASETETITNDLGAVKLHLSRTDEELKETTEQHSERLDDIEEALLEIGIATDNSSSRLDEMESQIKTNKQDVERLTGDHTLTRGLANAAVSQSSTNKLVSENNAVQIEDLKKEKQDKLVDGVNISTINGRSLLTGEDLQFNTENIVCTIEGQTIHSVGGIKAGVSLYGKTLYEILAMMFFAAHPQLIDPEFIATISSHKVAANTSVTLRYYVHFNRGEIKPAFETSGYRVGTVSSYIIGKEKFNSTSLQRWFDVTYDSLDIGTTTVKVTVNFGQGEQPLDSQGYPFGDPYPHTSLTQEITIEAYAPSATGISSKTSLKVDSAEFLSGKFSFEDVGFYELRDTETDAVIENGYQVAPPYGGTGKYSRVCLPSNVEYKHVEFYSVLTDEWIPYTGNVTNIGKQVITINDTEIEYNVYELELSTNGTLYYRFVI